MKRGTKNKTRQQIDDELTKLGATLTVSSAGLPGLMTVSLQAKRPNLTASLALLAEVLREPNFPENEFEQLKTETLEALDKGKTEPQQLAGIALRRKISPYPADDVRYTPTIEEEIARTKAVTLDAVKDVYATMIGANGELAVVGDFDAAETTKQLDAALKGWAAKVPFKRIASEAKQVAGETVLIPTPDKANAVYLAGTTLPISDTDPDYASLVVGNYAFGAAPLASRLSNRVRGKDGLSYGVGSMVQASPIDKVGRVMVFAIANPTNMPKVDSAIADEWAKFLKEGLSADELEGAKKAYLQSRQVQRASDGGLAGQLANDLYVGRTMAFAADFEKKVETIQPGDVTKAFNKHVDPKKLVIVQAGDFKK
jgi:zinc protease